MALWRLPCGSRKHTGFLDEGVIKNEWQPCTFLKEQPVLAIGTDAILAPATV